MFLIFRKKVEVEDAGAGREHLPKTIRIFGAAVLAEVRVTPFLTAKAAGVTLDAQLFVKRLPLRGISFREEIGGAALGAASHSAEKRAYRVGVFMVGSSLWSGSFMLAVFVAKGKKGLR